MYVLGGIMLEGHRIQSGKGGVVDQNVYVGTEEEWGLLDKAVARQRALSDFSLLRSCILVPHITEKDIVCYLAPIFLIKNTVALFPGPQFAPWQLFTISDPWPLEVGTWLSHDQWNVNQEVWLGKGKLFLSWYQYHHSSFPFLLLLPA